MTTTLEVHVPGAPIPQGSMNAYKRGTRIVMVHAKGQHLQRWRHQVHNTMLKESYLRNVPLPIDCPVSIKVSFVLPRPKRPRFFLPAVKPDLDKLQRAIGDALSGGNPPIIKDDSRIVKWAVSKVYETEHVSPSATITLQFNNEQEAPF